MRSDPKIRLKRQYRWKLRDYHPLHQHRHVPLMVFQREEAILHPKFSGSMCGIAGSINFPLHYPTVVTHMGHRGPDDQQGYRTENIDLFHLRLSILDIANGQQPMHLDGRYTIIFNGEIYNHQEIRQQENLVGQTHSDTETLLLLYQKMGMDMLHKLDGMFAFALYDAEEKALYLARDRAGKKPIHYYLHQNQFVFASELNALRALLPLQLNSEYLHEYLRVGALYRSHTPYQHVRELPGGHFLRIDTKSLDISTHAWWDIRHFYHPRSNDSLEESLHRVDSLLHQAVRRRVESSDLEVGSFLSGGIDSGLVTAIASQYKPQLKTFTVSFDGAFNEGPLAKLVAEKYQTQHTEIPIRFDELEQDIETILCNYGEPFFDSSAIPSYYVSREARKHLTVILNGDGADELFGGYRRYVPFARYDFFGSHPILRGAARGAAKILPPSQNKKSLYNYAYRLADLAGKKGADLYLSAGTDIFEGYTNAFMHVPANHLQSLREDATYASQQNHWTGLQKLMYLDFVGNLFSDLLVKMDIATMAHSLEGRSPLLAKELLEYVPGLPDNRKINGKTTKFLLRELGKKYLPAELITQPKRGFEIPLKQWVNGMLNPIIQDYLRSPQALHRQLLQAGFVDQLLDKPQRFPAEKRAKMLYTLLSLEVWYAKVYKSG
jgi:asparagine synthase (glutamine-hydrolysing)